MIALSLGWNFGEVEIVEMDEEQKGRPSERGGLSAKSSVCSPTRHKQ
jgi:hypothetical protein